MKEQEAIMAEAGFVTAAKAAEAIGASQVGTLHRAVKSERMIGARAGMHWYVSVASLLHEYRGAEPILARIRELGVTPNPEHVKKINGVKPKKKAPNGKRTSRAATG